MRWPAWVVRVAIFGGLGLLLLIAIGGRVRADRALERANEVRDMGTPGEVAARAQQAVSVWAAQPAVVVKVEREGRHWRATAMVGPDCYQLAVGEEVSAHPGLVPCPPISAAGSADDSISSVDPRYGVVAGFLDAWLRGDPSSDRYLADGRPSLAPPAEMSSDVKITAIFGPSTTASPGARSVVTARADVTYHDRTEALGWTLVLLRGDNRWSVDQLVGGEIPTGDPTDLVTGRSDPQPRDSAN